MSGPVRPFPWEEAMGLGFGVLRLSPEAFWRMTPRELASAFAIHLPRPDAAFTRARLDALMARFPDAPRPASEPP